MKLFLGPLAGLFVLATVLAIGCSAETPAEDPVESSTVEGELTASCKYPRRYIAVVADGACTEVTAKRGRWVPSPLFEDAPPEANACVYSWSGEKWARVDRDVLYRHVQPFTSGALTPSCGKAERVRDAVTLQPIESLDVFASAGSVGCDVCGIVKEGKLWVVLPPEKIFNRQFAVSLTDGSVAKFQIHADQDARAIAVPLPPTAQGVEYVEGHVKIY